MKKLLSDSLANACGSTCYDGDFVGEQAFSENRSNFVEIHPRRGGHIWGHMIVGYKTIMLFSYGLTSYTL